MIAIQHYLVISHIGHRINKRLIIGIMPARLIAAGHDFARQPVGSGPLRLAAWNRTLKLERIADHQSIVPLLDLLIDSLPGGRRQERGSHTDSR